MTNESDDGDAYEMIPDWFVWGFQATLTSATSSKEVKVSETFWTWNSTFELRDHNDEHFATLTKFGGGCCAPDFYEVTRVQEDDETSYGSSDDSEDSNLWFTVEEDFDARDDPAFTFRQPNHYRSRSPKKAVRVAKLSTDLSSWQPEHTFQIRDDCSKKEIRTVLAVALTIIKLNERKRKQQNQ